MKKETITSTRIVYSEEDVKEAIKRLKEEFPIGTMDAILKKIFGEKLI